jgi:hypothetical protein
MVARIAGMLNYFLVRLVDRKKMGALKVILLFVEILPKVLRKS